MIDVYGMGRNSAKGVDEAAGKVVTRTQKNYLALLLSHTAVLFLTAIAPSYAGDAFIKRTVNIETPGECGDTCGFVVRHRKAANEIYLCNGKSLQRGTKIPVCIEIFGLEGSSPNRAQGRAATLILKQDRPGSTDYWIVGGRLLPVAGVATDATDTGIKNNSQFTASDKTKTVAPSPTTTPRYTVVQSGENAPEGIVRVLSSKDIAPGKHQATIAGGPCYSDSKNKSVIWIESGEMIKTGDIFFIVPVQSAQANWALRRANSKEMTQYMSCKWR